MNKKILIGIIVALGAVIILETAYLLKIKRRAPIKEVITITQPVTVASPAYLEWDPFAEMERMQRRMSRIFDDSFFSEPRIKRTIRANLVFQPSIGFKQEEDRYVLKADLPGMDKNAINVEVKGRSLVISGERKEEKSKEGEGFAHQELSYGSFYRSILLPQDALVKNITSEYKNGVLTVNIPREMQEKKTEQKVKVQVQ